MTPAAPRLAPLLLALIVGQIGMHAAMAGLRMAAPLDALAQGASPWRVGLLLGLFAAAPVLLALAAGRMVDRLGYHRPQRLAVAMVAAGLIVAAASTWLPAPWRFVLMCGAAALAGGGANLGLIASQRTAGMVARSAVDRVRVFSWMGIAPALANVIGPVAAGLLIDGTGFGWSYAAMLVLPLASALAARRVPPQPGRPRAGPPRPALELLRTPGVGRLLLVNWLLSTAWDVHSFAVPILGHGLGFSATTIGLVLGSFTAAVTGVRLVIPLLAERLRETTVLRSAMLGTAVVFGLYPLATDPWLMACAAVGLGLMLGSVQPMIMSTLHRLTPEDRHGEALALRSMTINAASATMPLAFGAAGALVGAGVLFWAVGAAIAAGSAAVKRLDALGR